MRPFVDLTLMSILRMVSTTLIRSLSVTVVCDSCALASGKDRRDDSVTVLTDLQFENIALHCGLKLISIDEKHDTNRTAGLLYGRFFACDLGSVGLNFLTVRVVATEEDPDGLRLEPRQ